MKKPRHSKPKKWQYSKPRKRFHVYIRDGNELQLADEYVTEETADRMASTFNQIYSDANYFAIKWPAFASFPALAMSLSDRPSAD